VPYCVLSGYRDYPITRSDVDCVVGIRTFPRTFARLLLRELPLRGYRVVQSLQHEPNAFCFVLASGKDPDVGPVALDVSTDYRFNAYLFFSGEELLENRRRFKYFWIASNQVEFAYYLVKKIVKGKIDNGAVETLTALYKEDRQKCKTEIRRWWGEKSTAILVTALESGNWQPVRVGVARLRRELLIRAALRRPAFTSWFWIAQTRRAASRWLRPTGLHVVLLGPDGSGKSSLSRLLVSELGRLFPRSSVRHLTPGLLPRVSGSASVSSPHSQEPYSPLRSLAKVLYWSVEFTVGYLLLVRPALVASTLVIFDRYLLDALVDPRRYRYGGPQIALRLLWRLSPKPDLIIFLDAPPAALSERKLELPLEELHRQREAYRRLAEETRNALVVDASAPLEEVASKVVAAIHDFMSSRVARRFD